MRGLPADLRIRNPLLSGGAAALEISHPASNSSPWAAKPRAIGSSRVRPTVNEVHAMFIVPMTRTPEWVRSFLFDGSFDRLLPSASTQAALPRSPALDVAESDQAYTVTLDLPGLAKGDVKVSIEGRRVQIQAQSGKSDERKEGDRVLVRERAESSYARSFVLPVELDQERSTAKLDNGVLTLELAKRRSVSATQIAIN
jgi:HSP20 family protein